MPAATGRWRLEPAKSGGGPLYDIASHRIDVLNFWFGQPRAGVGAPFQRRASLRRGRLRHGAGRLRERRRAASWTCAGIPAWCETSAASWARTAKLNLTPLNGPELRTSGRGGRSARAREPALSVRGEFRERHRGRGAPVRQRRVVDRDRLGDRTMPGPGPAVVYFSTWQMD